MKDSREKTEQALRDALTARGLPHPSYAVVIPVIWNGNGGAELLIEVRAAGISQAGDPCFPGGRIEPGETPAQAAAREMEEELGIRVDPARFLGQLPTVQTILGSRSDVFVCVLSAAEAADVQINPSEVAELLRAPMSFFLARPGAASFPVGGHSVWGMTAGAVRHLCDAWRRAGLPDA